MATRKKGESWLEESARWDRMSVQELIDSSEPWDVKFIDARPKKAISLRLTETLIAAGKEAAGELGIGYQTLFRMWLMEGLRRHRLQKLQETAARKRRTA